MDKREMLNGLLARERGVLKTADVVSAGISKTYLADFVKAKGLKRAAQGLYLSPDAWEDGFYLLQARYAQAIFSHEAALYLWDLTDREPLRYSVTVKAGYNAPSLVEQGAKVYRVKKELYETGVTEALTPGGHMVRVYNMERTICDIIRSRRTMEAQDLQTAIKAYVRKKERNIPRLMEYAKLFHTEKILRQYLEVLL